MTSLNPSAGRDSPTLVDPSSRALRVLIGLAATFIVIVGLRGASGLIGPTFLALVLTVVTQPLRRALQRRRVPGWLSSAICSLGIYVVLLGLGAAMLVALARFATLLPDYEAQFDDLMANLGSWLHSLGVDQSASSHVVGSLDLGKLTDAALGVLGGLFGVLSNFLFILALVLFMTIDASVFSRILEQTGKERGHLVDALVGFAEGTRSYLVVSTVFGIIVAILDTIALALMGIPVPLLWGLLAFITNYVPNIGFVIGLIPVAVLGLLEGGPGLMLAVIAVYSVLNVVIQSIIQPKFVGDAVGLSTTLTFLSLVVWSWILGPLGALLAIPLSLLVRAILVDADPANRWVVPLLSNHESEPSPESEPG